MGRRAQKLAIVLLGAMALAGCKEKTVRPPEPNEYKEGLKFVKEEWLKGCEGLGPRPGDKVGDLLEDFNDAASLGGECKARHDSFVEYMRPLVEKAKTN